MMNESLQYLVLAKLAAMELDWPLPQKKDSPLHIAYTPDPVDLSEKFVNPFFGYPNCPIIGRYNRGQYRIGQTLLHLEFQSKFNHKQSRYDCGGRPLNIPEPMVHNIRNIPEFIINNKAAGIKNSPEILPETYPVRDELSVYWVISFGELGKDFLNYLNHIYILASTLFLEEKLKRTVHYLPIYAFLPENSGLNDFQVERGLNFKNYRGQYMSFHLSKGAPAFSPNNMRLSLLGGKIITSQQPAKQQKKEKGKPKYIQKQKFQQMKAKEQKNQEQVMMDWDEIQNKTEKDNHIECEKMQGQKKESVNVDLKEEREDKNPKGEQIKKTHEKEEKNKKAEKKQKAKEQNYMNYKKQQRIQNHQGFIHFYSSLLLENDYRIYYHWHIQDNFKQETIRQILKQSTSVEEFLSKYQNFVGIDSMFLQANRLLLGDK